MLKDIRSIKLQGANFTTEKVLNIFGSSNEGQMIKLAILYGRNGAGKSTIAKAFRKIAGEVIPSVVVSEPMDSNNSTVVLSDREKSHIYIFDEDYVDNNVRIEGSGLESIVMLGEQADLTKQIEKAEKDFLNSEDVVKAKEEILREYQVNSNPKAPRFYSEKMKGILSNGNDCWAERERKAKDLRRNASVNEDTYKKFINLSPGRTRDELIIAFNDRMGELSKAKSGSSTIGNAVPGVSKCYKSYTISLVNELLKMKIEKPELSEREQYLLSLISDGRSDELQERIDYLERPKTTYCPYCLQNLTPAYKHDLKVKIQKVLSDEVKEHQNKLKMLKIDELVINLGEYETLPSYNSCMNMIESLNAIIRFNNGLLDSKIEDPYTPIVEEAKAVTEELWSLENVLKKLDEERISHNSKAVQTKPIIDDLVSINDQIAYYDVIELSKQHDKQKKEMDAVQNKLKEAMAERDKKKETLDELNSRRKRIDIAIDIINSGLKYIFFSESRLSIRRDGDYYKLYSHGKPVEPKNVSVGERNIIGLCYFFTSILKEKNKETAYDEEYLIVIDDPISSYDFENRVGILSFLKYKLSQFLGSNVNTKTLLLTHDLLTMFDIEKIAKALSKEWSFAGVKTNYSLTELKECELERFKFKERQEYTELLKHIYDYACGEATDYDIVMGNMMRQALEAFGTFEYRKGIEAISIDDSILNGSEMSREHKIYFKNLMYRIVLNGGSHREEQTRSMRLDFFSVISEEEKRRTAREILCFIYLLNKQHILAHIGEVSNMLDEWCEEIKKRSAEP